MRLTRLIYETLSNKASVTLRIEQDYNIDDIFDLAALNMTIHFFYMLLLVVSVTLLLAQLFVAKKQTVHIVFAVFCGSISMVALQQLTQSNVGIYTYLIGLGTCATCNGFWLVARALFRGNDGVLGRHILLAVIIAGLIIAGQGINLAKALSIADELMLSNVRSVIGEVTNLLSSTVLMLTFWEAGRGFNSCTREQKHQRLLFMYASGSGVFLCTVAAQAFIPASSMQAVFPWFVVFSALQILVFTQGILIWQSRIQNRQVSVAAIALEEQQKYAEKIDTDNDVDPILVNQLQGILFEEKLFLQPSLKMIDIAKRLQVPEYKVSKAIRYHFKAANFNQYINQLRVDYAKSLLEESSNKHWSILVVGYESGFSSIGPFNRAFKARFACTPSEYRSEFLSVNQHFSSYSG